MINIYIYTHIHIFLYSTVSTVYCILYAVYVYECMICIHPNFENTSFISPHVIVFLQVGPNCDLRYAEEVFAVRVLKTLQISTLSGFVQSPFFQLLAGSIAIFCWLNHHLCLFNRYLFPSVIHLSPGFLETRSRAPRGRDLRVSTIPASRSLGAVVSDFTVVSE